MGRGIVLIVVLFIAFYALFWNANKWKWSTVKILLSSLGCSIIASSVVIAFLYGIYLIG